MTRIVKKPEVRRNELIMNAFELFQTQGYAATPVEAIIQKAGVAKGTFYHYFKSKEEIMEAVVENILIKVVEDASTLAANPSMSALEKLRYLLTNQSQSQGEAESMVENLHRPENRELHERMNVQSILKLSPIVAEIIEQGVREEVFHVDNILETMQILITGWQFLFDEGLFKWSQEEMISRTKALESILERSLGAEKGIASFLSDQF